jgi:hypothetical protein
MLSETGTNNIDELKITCRAVLRDIDGAVKRKDWVRIIRMASALKWVSDCTLCSVVDAERKDGRVLTTFAPSLPSAGTREGEGASCQ